jgi:transposase
MPVRVVVTAGAVADCAVAPQLIEGIKTDAVIADKGFDSQAVVDLVEAGGAEAVIPPRKNRKEQRAYDKHLYKIRHMVENAIQRLKEWRGVATRYAKRASSFLAIVQIRCTLDWLRIL